MFKKGNLKSIIIDGDYSKCSIVRWV
jgi:hypothetical protein